MKQDINSIFILKAFGALFVLLIHFFIIGKQYFEPIYRTGVPIFFIISGYFLFTKTDIQRRIKKSIIKIVKIWFFLQIIYFIFNSFFYNINFNFNNLSSWVRLIIYGDNISGHLWFLNSYFFSLIILMLLRLEQIKENYIIFLAILITILGLFYGQYRYYNIFYFDYRQYYIPNIFMSFPMFIAGYEIHKNENYIKSYLSSNKICILVISMIILSYCEHKLLSVLGIYSGAFMFSTYLLTISLLLLCIKHKETVFNNTLIKQIVYLGKFHSANIYYWQFIPSIFIIKLIGDTNLRNYTFIIMFISLIILSYMINKLKRYIPLIP